MVMQWVQIHGTEHPRPRTVGDLKQMLADVPDTFLVRMEGCDCSGWFCGVDVDYPTGDEWPPYVYLERTDNDPETRG